MPATPHTLDEILSRMKREADNGDFEVAHAYADGLLIDALKVLGDGNPVVGEILEAYDNVGKWYA